MAEIYPLPGEQSSSDYIDNWVDKTIEKEIQRGKKLQDLKQKPTTRKNKYHIVSIGDTKFYSEKKRSARGSHSPTNHTRKVQNHSPNDIKSQPRKHKSKKDIRCPMRTAELAVPSKRHCIETWRNNYRVLPGIMIDRLKQHVFDMTPVVPIPDAIECFERCKNSKRRKRKTDKDKIKNRFTKTMENRNLTIFEDDPKTAPLKLQQIQNFCISFGHKIAKILFRPAIITLNPDLQKISSVITMEIEHLLRNGKSHSSKNFINNIIEAEVIAKITVWISDILDDTADKIIEDQLIELEEEIGHVLDFLDDLIDKVMDICEPEPVIMDISSSSETLTEETTSENIDDEDLRSRFDSKALKLDEYVKKELITIIDSLDKDYLDDENLVEDVEDNKNEIANSLDKDENLAVQDIEDNNNQNDITEEKNNTEEDEEIASTIIVPGSTAKHILKGTDSTDDTQPLEVNEQTEFQDANDNLGSGRNEEGNADQGTEVNDTINLESNEVDDDDLNKKVKFSEKGLVTNYDTGENEKSDLQKSDVINPDIVFAEPNDHLLSDADESWPEDMVSPVVRPSVSVNKSISSLGFVVEAEERTSIMLVDEAGVTHILKRTENDTTDNTKPLDITYAEKEGMKGLLLKQSVKYGSKDAQKIEEDLAHKAAGGLSHRVSTDSTFIGDVLTEPLTFENTLEKITENDAALQSQNILEEKAAQAKDLEKDEHDRIVHDEAIQASKLETGETSDKTTNTSFSLIQREDKSTSAVSQSLSDIAKRLSSGKPKFSSLRIKPKVDYKVNKDSAPAWVTQSFVKPKPIKEDSDKHIRLWCKDLQTGFENLELWNDWLENTLGNVEIMEREKARVEVYQSREEFIREWIHLKRNVDADVVTWIKHSHSTQEKIKCFRKVYKNFQEPSTNVKTCNCNKN